MTPTPSLDIIVPVWNSPTETRTCLVSILASTDTARLIIINNGCDRTTELMLEEFSDHLGDRAIYMTMERNIGFIPAVNRALERSDADWALVLRPTVTITADFIQQLLASTPLEQAGIITPYCSSDHQPVRHLTGHHCSHLETGEISFSAIALSRTVRTVAGLFDDTLDGGLWCLQDYRHRANAHNFRTYLLPNITINSNQTTVFGSAERRRKQAAAALASFHQRWGEQRHLAVYLPKESDGNQLSELLKLLLPVARNGHRTELLLHRRNHQLALEQRAGCLHSNIRLHKLAALTPLRSLAAKLAQLQAQYPNLQIVCGLDGTAVPGYDCALSLSTLQQLATTRPVSPLATCREDAWLQGS